VATNTYDKNQGTTQQANVYNAEGWKDICIIKFAGGISLAISLNPGKIIITCGNFFITSGQ